METEEERRTRLENDAATKRLRLAMETDEERNAILEKMVATAQLVLALIKGVVDMAHSEKKLDVLTTQAPTTKRTRRSVEHCTPHADGAWLNELGWSQ